MARKGPLTIVVDNCCNFIIAGLIIGFGIAYLAESKDYIHEHYHLWSWCLIVVISRIIFIINSIYKTIKNYVQEQKSNDPQPRSIKINTVNIILLLIDFGMLIWGCVLYNEIHYNQVYPQHLYIWFMVLFIAIIIGVGIIILSLTFMLCTFLTVGVPESLKIQYEV